MTNIRDLLGDKADQLARGTVSVGDVHMLPLTKEEGITPKDGIDFRNKFLVVLGFDHQGNAIGGVVVNFKVNYNLPSSITDYMMPVSVKQCPFLNHDSFVNCSRLFVVDKEKIGSNTFKGSIKDEELLDMIVGTVIDSPHVSRQQLREFGLIE